MHMTAHTHPLQSKKTSHVLKSETDLDLTRNVFVISVFVFLVTSWLQMVRMGLFLTVLHFALILIHQLVCDRSAKYY